MKEILSKKNRKIIEQLKETIIKIRPNTTNRKTVIVFVDDAAERDLTIAGITPEEILNKIVFLYQEENGLDFSYDFSRLAVRKWRHQKPPREFPRGVSQNPVHNFLFYEAERNIRFRQYDVALVLAGDLWVGSGLTELLRGGNGIILIGTKNKAVTLIDVYRNRVSMVYFYKKLLNTILFFLSRPQFLFHWEDFYLLAIAATGVHEQAHAFGISHSRAYSVMSYANIGYWRFDEFSRALLREILNSSKSAPK